MIALEIAGLVEVRTGSGIYVKKADGADQPLALPDAGPSPFHVIAARKLLEPEIAFIAAMSASPAELEGIVEALAQMRDAVSSGRDIMSGDRLFHTRIAAATHNTVLAPIIDQLWESNFAPIFSGLSRRVGLLENQRAAVSDHARIAEALERRDAAAARDAMRDHLAQVETIMMAEDTT
jgi:DNA-binding FadR family transcriptional regulator